MASFHGVKKRLIFNDIRAAKEGQVECYINKLAHTVLSIIFKYLDEDSIYLAATCKSLHLNKFITLGFIVYPFQRNRLMYLECYKIIVVYKEDYHRLLSILSNRSSTIKTQHISITTKGNDRDYNTEKEFLDMETLQRLSIESIQGGGIIIDGMTILRTSPPPRIIPSSITSIIDVCIMEEIVFPPNLKHFKGSIYYHLEEGVLPEGLETLKLKYDKPIFPGMFPSTLKYIEMSQVETILPDTFYNITAESLTIIINVEKRLYDGSFRTRGQLNLDLGYPYNLKLETGMLEGNITSLYITGPFRPTPDSKLPSTLKSLKYSNTWNLEHDGFIPDTLQDLKFHATLTYINQKDKLPRSLTSLEIRICDDDEDDNPLDLQYLPETLLTLKISFWSVWFLVTRPFPKNIKHLIIESSQRIPLEIFPPTLESLIIHPAQLLECGLYHSNQFPSTLRSLKFLCKQDSIPLSSSSTIPPYDHYMKSIYQHDQYSNPHLIVYFDFDFNHK